MATIAPSAPRPPVASRPQPPAPPPPPKGLAWNMELIPRGDGMGRSQQAIRGLTGITALFVVAFLLFVGEIQTYWFGSHVRAPLTTYNCTKIVGDIALPHCGLTWSLHYSDTRQLRGKTRREVGAYLGLSRQTMAIGIIGLLLSPLAGGWFLSREKKTRRRRTEKGAARYAYLKEVKAAGLLDDTDKPGIVLACVWVPGPKPLAPPELRFVVEAGDTHVLAAMPTRSGKGIGPVLCTALTFPGGIVALDVKFEIRDAAWRARHERMGHNVYSLNWFDDTGYGSCYNFCDTVRIFSPHDVSDGLRLAYAFVYNTMAGDKGSNVNAYFNLGATYLVAGLILDDCYTPDVVPSMPRVARKLNSGNVVEMIQKAVQTAHDPGFLMRWTGTDGKPTRTHPAVLAFLTPLLNMSDKTRGEVINTAVGALNIFMDPKVQRTTSVSTFGFQDIVDGEVPGDVALATEVGDIDVVRILNNAWIDLFVRHQCRGMKRVNGRSVSPHRWPGVFLGDEMINAVGKVPILGDAITYAAGYGWRFLCVVTDQDGFKIYGDQEAFTANLQTRVVARPNKPETAKRLAELFGVDTDDYYTKSYDNQGRRSESEHVDKSDLLSADKIMRLHNDDVLVQGATEWPFAAVKARFFYDELLNELGSMEPLTRFSVTPQPARMYRPQGMNEVFYGKADPDEIQRLKAQEAEEAARLEREQGQLAAGAVA